MRHVVTGVLCGCLWVAVWIPGGTAGAAPGLDPDSPQPGPSPSARAEPPPPVGARPAVAPTVAPAVSPVSQAVSPAVSAPAAAPTSVSANRPVAPSPSAPRSVDEEPGSSRGPDAPADATRDRAFLLPTADTLPEGALVYNDYELLFMGLTYAIRDGLQVTATTLVPLTTDFPVLLQASLKWRFVSQRRFKLAALGGFGFGSAGSGSSESGHVLLANGGLLATVCFDLDCESTVTAGVLALNGRSGSSSGTAAIFGGTALVRMSTHVKFMMELDGFAGHQPGSGWTVAAGGLVWYGVRLFGSKLAGDVGFVRLIGDSGSDNLILGIPFVSLSYRIL